MSLSWSASRASSFAAPARLAALALLSLAAAVLPARALQVSSSAGWHDVDLAGYRQHLQALEGVVTDCAAQLALKQPPPASQNACDPDRVGPDDRVAWPAAAGSAPREVTYDWLRSVLDFAGSKDNRAPAAAPGAHANAKNGHPSNPGDLLNIARQRLEMDEHQAESSLAANPSYAAQRASLNAILARREYQGVTETSASDRFWEWVDNLLDKIVTKLGGLGARAPWAARLLEGLLLAAVCTALVWFFIRIERNARIRLVPDAEPAPGSPSSREWQLWMKEAQAAAAGGQWREAIHSVYWASIARLESGRLWPADRARTPREYLGLVGGNDPRKPTLTALTRSFERTWYGGREAAAGDFNAALQLAAELGAKAE